MPRDEASCWVWNKMPDLLTCFAGCCRVPSKTDELPFEMQLKVQILILVDTCQKTIQLAQHISAVGSNAKGTWGERAQELAASSTFIEFNLQFMYSFLLRVSEEVMLHSLCL